MSRNKDAVPPGESQPSSLRGWLQIGFAASLAAPAPVIHALDMAGVDLGLPALVESAIFGLSIFAAATLLVWATEVAEQLVSAALALAVLAIIAVLPEYAVDIYFAWTAPDTPAHAGFALANMTGANRLLVGFAWPVVFFIFLFRSRRNNNGGEAELKVGNQNAMGLVFLAVASIYNLFIPLRRELSVIDSGVLITLFLAYLASSLRAPPHQEEELVGPALAIAALPLRQRSAVVVAIFAFAAGTVFAAAEPFATGLIDTGKSLGIDEFLLVQWVAPLASESPEFILAGMLAWRGRAQAGMTLLASAEVSQWTLLVGSLPAAYAISGGSFAPLPMDDQQVAEVFLTGALAIFAVAVLMSLSLNTREAGIMLFLFVLQLFLPFPHARIALGVVYLVLAVVWFARERQYIPRLFSTARREFAQAGATNPGDGEH